MRTRILVRALRVAPVSLLLASAPSLLAHAILVRSTPANGAVVHTSSVEFTLDYDSRIDARLSTLTLQGPQGKQIPLTRESSSRPNELKAKVSRLSAGIYHVHWQALASDGHITRGAIEFTVASTDGNPARK